MASVSFDDWLYEDVGERVPSPTPEARVFSPPTPRFEPRRNTGASDSVPPLEDLVSTLPDAEEVDDALPSATPLADREELASELLHFDAKDGDQLDGLKAVIEDALATLTPGAKPAASGGKRSFTSSEEREKGSKAAKKAAKNEEEEDGPAQVCTYVCRFAGCGKSYASTDAVRKHCRQRHLEWLRALGHGTPELYCQCIVSPAE